MLKQDAVPAESSVPPVSVAQARVTPDELASALAAIEARRQAEAAHLAGTIPIEQAVSDLHLDSTSDEIWAEVQQQRAKASAPPPAPHISEAAEKAQPPLEALFQRLRERTEAYRRGRTRRRPRRVWSVFAAVMFGWLLLHSGLLHQIAPSITISGHTPIAAPHLRPLSAIPDGAEVYADDAALSQISKGKPTGQISVSQDSNGNSWTLVKMGGHVYLRGFTVQADSLAALVGKALPVYNDDDSGEFHEKATSNITLRVDGVPLEKSGGDGDYSSIIVPNFQQDSFTTLTPGR